MSPCLSEKSIIGDASHIQNGKRFRSGAPDPFFAEIQEIDPKEFTARFADKKAGSVWRESGRYTIYALVGS